MLAAGTQMCAYQQLFCVHVCMCVYVCASVSMGVRGVCVCVCAMSVCVCIWVQAPEARGGHQESYCAIIHLPPLETEFPTELGASQAASKF